MSIGTSDGLTYKSEMHHALNIPETTHKFLDWQQKQQEQAFVLELLRYLYNHLDGNKYYGEIPENIAKWKLNLGDWRRMNDGIEDVIQIQGRKRWFKSLKSVDNFLRKKDNEDKKLEQTKG